MSRAFTHYPEGEYVRCGRCTRSRQFMCMFTLAKAPVVSAVTTYPCHERSKTRVEWMNFLGSILFFSGLKYYLCTIISRQSWKKQKKVMPDQLSQQQRHANMAAIHSRNTKPEWVVRRWLWHHGFRYRLNDRRLPGHPDLVLKKYRTCIFVNGCFWHGHDGCCKIPKTNRDFWLRKITRNKERDRETLLKLKQMGWHTVTVWECELKGNRRAFTLSALVNTLREILLREQHPPKPYDYDDYYDFELPMAAEDSVHS